MTPKFSKTSMNRLAEVEFDLASVVRTAMHMLPKLRKIMDWDLQDFSVTCGHRSGEEQEKLFKEGKSQARAGQSPHNFKPSRAVDLLPYPWDWSNVTPADMKRFKELVELIKICAAFKNYRVTSGSDWPRFKDWPHFERADWKTSG